MVTRPYSVVETVFHKKMSLVHRRTGETAVAELRLVRFSPSESYVDGIKYSFFLVSEGDGRVIIGFDNHRPKGPHLHRKGEEVAGYGLGMSIFELEVDFWRLVEEEEFVR